MILLIVITLIAGLLMMSAGNQNAHYNHLPRQHTYPPGMYGYDYDREYYRYRREREYSRLVATLIFIVLMVVVFATLSHGA